MTPETKLKQEVKKYLDNIGAYHLPYFPTMFTPSGIPDCYCCINGISFWVEFKAEKGKLSKIQEYQIEKMKEHKIIVKVLYPHLLEEFKEFCQQLKRGDICDKAIYHSTINAPIPTT